LIYVTTGNTGDRHLVDLALKAFADDDSLAVVITTGAYLDLSHVITPPHIRLERFVPGSTVLQRAAVAVHCGGNGTTYQVIGHGRPAVVIPFTNDQRVNAALVMHHGLGLALDPKRTRPANFSAAITKAWHDVKIRARLEHFQLLVTEADGPGLAATEIEKLGYGPC
jgi:UDP:flavonoid glycosyltransferase YjiC (YdhE family)